MRFKSFLFGIIFASTTWAVSLYLYWRLTQDSSSSKYTPTQPSFMLSAKYSRKGDVNLPYEDDFKKYMRSKAKYFDPDKFENSDKLLKHLQPKLIKPVGYMDEGLAELGMVKTVEDLRFRDEGYKLHGFNALASRNLGYNRTIPDTRHKLCGSLKYPETLPNASVIMCFYNEQIDTLIRSVHSVLNRTPVHLLREIILVDDYSDIDGLNREIRDYIETKLKGTKKVVLYKTEQREGLIRARIFGARHASGQVLVFLDSHVEVNQGWLEPLLSRIYENPKRVVTPIIDIINADTFEYTSSPIVRGGFNWGLHFKWENPRTGTLDKDEDFVKPIKSPTMAGGLFAMDRKYFTQLGEYDSGMNIWGGENLEISFRIWMCGGILEIIPCSRVGHVFRKRRPYTSPDGEDTMTRNSLRVAHVWMDEYKEKFFKQRPDAVNAEYGDISDRVQLRKKLGCKSFSWYVENIYPELEISTDNNKNAKKGIQIEQHEFQPWHLRKRNYIAEYQIRLTNTSLCITAEKDFKTKGSLLILKSCLRTKNQMWYETDKNELVLGQLLCLDAGEQKPKLSKCHEMGGSQEWRHRGEKATPIYSIAAGTCLSADKPSINSYVLMEICSSERNSHWDLVLASAR